MNIQLRSPFLTLASLGVALLTPKAQAAPATAPKFAVLVGITEYHQTGISKLDGCLNDVRDMKQMLISNFGLAPANILTLTNAQAKRADIVNAIRTHLRDNAKQNPEGTFLFYFSGHGSHTKDKNGDEKLNDPSDVDDETLVTYDTDLLDDDLDTLCREVRSVPNFTGSLTVISDSCHSGTNTRSASRPGEPHVRSASPDPERIGAPLVSLVQGEKEVVGGSFVALSGCLASQTSEEQEFTVKTTEGGKTTERDEYHGVLTHFLLKEMANATQTTTNDQIWTQVAGELSGQFDQLPQLEGGRPGQRFLGGALKDTLT
ncbi:MAG: caspase family protein, partial [Proteobacteria bacterium]